MEITKKLPLKLYYTIHQNRHPMEIFRIISNPNRSTFYKVGFSIRFKPRKKYTRTASQVSLSSFKCPPSSRDFRHVILTTDHVFSTVENILLPKNFKIERNLQSLSDSRIN